MKTLEDTRKEKAWWEEHVHTKQLEYDIAKDSARRLEYSSKKTKQELRKALKQVDIDLKTAKKLKEKLDRELRFAKKQVQKKESTIKATPSRVRHWGKKHPGELINTLGDGKT